MALFTKIWNKSFRYEKLSVQELRSLGGIKTRGSMAYRWVIYIFVLLCASIALGSLGYYAGLYAAGSCDCHAPLDWSTPGFDNFSRQSVKFVGSFESVSPYRGPPSPEVDAAWARFTVSDWVDGTAVVLGVGPEEVRHARKDKEEEWFNSTVQLGDENGGGMMASLEIFHQLHCLDLVRKFTVYKYAYYKTTGGVFDKSLEIQQNHIDHCLEIIRQVLMCNADTGLITFHWVANNPVAYPDFNTWHSCRDPEEVLALAKNHAAPMRQQVRKAGNDVNMPAPP